MIIACLNMGLVYQNETRNEIGVTFADRTQRNASTVPGENMAGNAGDSRELVGIHIVLLRQIKRTEKNYDTIR